MNLQDVVDELADSLDRPVLVDDRDGRLLAASERAAAKRGHRALSLVPDAGHERLAVPIRDASGALGTLWLATGGLAPLTAAHYPVIGVAADVARSILAQGSGRSETLPPRTTGLAALLDLDQSERRRAFSASVPRERLERGDPVSVRAVALESGPRTIERLAFGRRLGSARQLGLDFVGERSGVLHFLERHGHAVDARALGAAIRSEAAGRGLTVRGIGSARIGLRDDDLLPTADRAARAAEIVAWLPTLGGVADIAQLGAWVLLDSVDGGPEQLELFSPAAHRLRTEGTLSQQQTVESYLDVGGRVRDACDRLHIHRTTLYYRLDNLPDDVKAALDDGLSRSALHLCLKLARYWKATGRI